MGRWQRSLAIGAALLAVSAMAACSTVGPDEARDTTATTGDSATRIPAPRGPVTGVEALTEPSLPPQRPQATPTEAVQAFLSAEIAQDYALSFSLLSTDDRSTAGDQAAWQFAHAHLPTYVDFTTESATPDGVVTTAVKLRPELGEADGYVPGDAVVRWPTTSEGGGFTVRLSEMVADPILPSDDGAAAAAVRWAGEVAAGESGTDLQYDGSLLGQPTVPKQLRRAKVRGTFQAAPPKALDDWPDVATITNALGPEAVEWTRVVSLTGPVGLDVVVAPLGADWRVVGVVAT